MEPSPALSPVSRRRGYVPIVDIAGERPRMQPMRAEEERMLVLARLIREALVMTLPDGRTITVRVMEIVGGKVRLGIEAPRDIVVNREEIQREIDAGRTIRVPPSQLPGSSDEPPHGGAA